MSVLDTGPELTSTHGYYINIQSILKHTLTF